MKTTLLTISILLILYSCNEQPKEVKPIEKEVATVVEAKPAQDLFYHYSIWYAFVNKVFKGNLTAGELKEKGNIGLGSYSQLDGELIMLDGVLYRATQDGAVTIAEDEDKIIYANATFFDNEKSFDLKDVANYESLREAINGNLKSKNVFHAFKIHGEFNSIKLGGLHKQEEPFENGLNVLIPNRPIFKGENVKGTMVGFFCPDFIGQINVAGYHLHFVSDDKKLAGHVMEFDAKSLQVQMDYMYEYQFVLPETEEYHNVGFDAEFQYHKR